MIDPHLYHVPRLGRHPGRFRLAGTPVIIVMLGSALTALPFVAQSPVMPPFGLLLLLVWLAIAALALIPIARHVQKARR